jgi:hypothetical protein
MPGLRRCRCESKLCDKLLSMWAALTSLYASVIIFAAVFLFVAVGHFEPNARLAVIFEWAILATGGGSLASPLVPYSAIRFGEEWKPGTF